MKTKGMLQRQLAFSSWSHPGHKISLKPERTAEQMANDDRAFVYTGEWNLEYMDVTERVGVIITKLVDQTPRHR